MSKVKIYSVLWILVPKRHLFRWLNTVIETILGENSSDFVCKISEIFLWIALRAIDCSIYTASFDASGRNQVIELSSSILHGLAASTLPL